MRIVILADLIPPDAIGGAGRMAWALATGLHTQGHDVHVITSTADKSHHRTQDGVSIHALYVRYPLRWRAWVSLYNPQVIESVEQLLTTLKPDVVNAHNVHMYLSYAVLWIAKRHHIPVVYTAHDAMTVAYDKVVTDYANTSLPFLHNLKTSRLRYNPFRNWIIRQILWRYTDARTAVSQSLATFLEHNHLPSFSAIHNGLPRGNFERPSDEVINACQEAWNLNNRKVILFGGRLSEGKGGQQILAALNQLIPQMPNVTLLVLSATPIDPAWLAQHPNITPDHIRETGWLSGDKLKAAYVLSDVVTTPSIYLDPFVLLNVEAAAFRKPVVGTCFGGTSEIVVDGETGYIINPHDTATYQQRLKTLLENDALQKKMGLAARQRYEQLFTEAHYIQNMVSLYESVRPTPK